MLDRVFVGTSKENGWFHDIEYEGNNAYCTYCGLLGHVVGPCRKEAQIQGKTQVVETTSTPTVAILKCGYYKGGG